MNKMRALKLTVVFVTVLSWIGLTSPTVRVYADASVGTGTPASCTGAAFHAALVIGGTITFQCGSSPKTIDISSEETIASNITIDGGTRGLITISGLVNGTTPTQIFTVTSGSSLTLKNLIISDGQATGANGGAILYNGGNSSALTISTTSL